MKNPISAHVRWGEHGAPVQNHRPRLVHEIRRSAKLIWTRLKLGRPCGTECRVPVLMQTLKSVLTWISSDATRRSVRGALPLPAECEPGRPLRRPHRWLALPPPRMIPRAETLRPRSSEPRLSSLFLLTALARVQRRLRVSNSGRTIFMDRPKTVSAK